MQLPPKAAAGGRTVVAILVGVILCLCAVILWQEPAPPPAPEAFAAGSRSAADPLSPIHQAACAARIDTALDLLHARTKARRLVGMVLIARNASIRLDGDKMRRLAQIANTTPLGITPRYPDPILAEVAEAINHTCLSDP